jgi:hypothetical protein
LDLEQRQSPWACSYYQVDGWGGVLPERPMMILRRPELCCSCFYSHEGDPDLVVLPVNQDSDEYHRRQPWEAKEET